MYANELNLVRRQLRGNDHVFLFKISDSITVCGCVFVFVLVDGAAENLLPLYHPSAEPHSVLKGVSRIHLIKSLHHTSAPPSPYHYFLAAFEHLSRLIDRHSRGLLMKRMAARLGTNEPNEANVMRLDVLSDDVLLDIFDFYTDTSSSDAVLRKLPLFDNGNSETTKAVEAWQTLVHVCQQWRSLVFLSPRRLNLRLVCIPGTRTMDPNTLDVWPSLPLIVKGSMASSSLLSDTDDVITDHVIAVLGQSNRIREVNLCDLTHEKLEQVSAAMQVPFPELIYLELSTDELELPPVISDNLLGGSAPRLQYIDFSCISFPGLSNLLLSATHLVGLRHDPIPPSGYVPPDIMVASLALSSLERLHLGFEFPEDLPDLTTRRPPPPKRSTLPALEDLTFSGPPGYLEELVSHIDTPQLDHLDVSLDYPDEIDFPFERLARFINRTPKLSKWDKARMEFNDWHARILFGTSRISIHGSEPDWLLSSIAQVCDPSLHSLSTVQGLSISHGYPLRDWNYNSIENNLWLRLLLPFTAVKNLYVSEDFAPHIAAALQELVGGRVTEVLPRLQNIFVKRLGSFEKNFGEFVATRQLSGHPIAISDWVEN